jgi:hypothetical protein
MRVGEGGGNGVGGITVAVRVGRGVRVGAAEGRAEGVTEGAGVAEGGAEEAEAARVAVGVSVVAVPQPAINNPTNINSRTREVSFWFMGQLLADAAPRFGSLSVAGCSRAQVLCRWCASPFCQAGYAASIPPFTFDMTIW